MLYVKRVEDEKYRRVHIGKPIDDPGTCLQFQADGDELDLIRMAYELFNTNCYAKIWARLGSEEKLRLQEEIVRVFAEAF